MILIKFYYNAKKRYLEIIFKSVFFVKGFGKYVYRIVWKVKGVIEHFNTAVHARGEYSPQTNVFIHIA